MTGYLDEIVRGDLVPGRYRLAVPVRVRELRDDLAAAGWTMCIVDGARMIDRPTLFDEFAMACDFPDWFGGNWDAFADCLRDLAGLPDRPVAILWQRSAALAAAEPGIWAKAGEVLDAVIADRADADLPPLYVIYPAPPAGVDADVSGAGEPMLRPVR